MLFLLPTWLICGCSAGQQPSTQVVRSEPETPARIEKLQTKHLPNAVRVHSQVIAGGLPDGDEAFAELKSLGVKTVISVDGAKPDLITAEKFGLRYVHLPHGYDGIPDRRAEELAKAVRDLPGPVYIHCHHGKHRSPAASAVACVGAGLIGKQQALTVLKVAGTSEHYRGLFASANTAHPLDQALLDKLEADFPSSAKLPAMAEAMVEIEHIHDHLKALEESNWRTIPTKPDLKAEHEALLLREQFTELLRTEEVNQHPKEFQQLMKIAEANAQELEDALRELASSDTGQAKLDSITSAFNKVNDNCKACHERFRDVPLSEKVEGLESRVEGQKRVRRSAISSLGHPTPLVGVGELDGQLRGRYRTQDPTPLAGVVNEPTSCALRLRRSHSVLQSSGVAEVVRLPTLTK